MTTTNYELQIMAKKMNIPLVGVFSRNNIDKIKFGNYIVNLDGQTGSGTHWVCFMMEKGLNIYFDSFGGPPPDEIKDVLSLNTTTKGYYFNNWIIQDLKSELCGYYCLAFFHYIKDKKNKVDAFNDFVNLFVDDTLRNTLILRDYYIRNKLLANTNYLFRLQHSP